MEEEGKGREERRGGGKERRGRENKRGESKKEKGWKSLAGIPWLFPTRGITPGVVPLGYWIGAAPAGASFRVSATVAVGG